MEFTLSPMAKGFLPYSLEQRILLPPDLRDWLPEGHLALVISDVVAALDVSELLLDHRSKDPRGRAGYHPAMMLTLLIYAYCIGKPSSRKIEKATYEDVAFRVISANQHPDHDAIADFRKRNVPAFSGLFAQVLLLCREAGLVKLGHVAIDGTKIQANASKHKAMSYERMDPAQKKLQDEIDALLAEAERVDAEEDVKHGKGKRGDELPQELARRETRLRKIQEAKERLEAEAKERASDKAAEVRAELERRAKNEIATGKKIGGPTPKTPDPRMRNRTPRRRRTSPIQTPASCPTVPTKGPLCRAITLKSLSTPRRRSLWRWMSRSRPMTGSSSFPWRKRSSPTAVSSRKIPLQTMATSASKPSTTHSSRRPNCSCRRAANG